MNLEVVLKDGEGSDRFVWDPSGEKVKHAKVLVTKKGDEISREELGTSFRVFA